MLAFYADHFVLPLPPGHRFPMRKYSMLRDAVMAGVEDIALREAPRADDEALGLAHTADYIAAVSSGALDPARQREIGFPWSPEMVERSRRSAGATIAACRVALAEGIAVNLAGGTHHAYADKGAGFCVFNDAAIAARTLQRDGAGHGTGTGTGTGTEDRANCRAGGAGGAGGAGDRERGGAPERARVRRVAVIDLDVHQGNGTAAILRDDPTIFTLSLHGEKNYPFRKEASDLDVGLPDGCDDDTYAEALSGALATLFARFTPDLLIYLAGADPHEGDRLGRLRLTMQGLARRDALVFEAGLARDLPIAVAMAGGYGHEIENTVAVHLQTVTMAARYHQLYRQRHPWRASQPAGTPAGVPAACAEAAS